MSTEIKAPAFPESVQDGTIAVWHKQEGDTVERDELLVDIETDKVVLEVNAPVAGVLLEIVKKADETVLSQEIIGRIVSSSAATSATASQVLAERSTAEQSTAEQSTAEQSTAEHASTTETAVAADLEQTSAPDVSPRQSASGDDLINPAARRLLAENHINVDAITGTGRDGRITKEDVINYMQSRTGSVQAAPVVEPETATTPVNHAVEAHVLETNVSETSLAETSLAETNAINTKATPQASGRSEQRVPMSRMRARIAERLLESKQGTAMLTTFNEVNMSALMDLRRRYRDEFEKQHQARLGFMSFFLKSQCCCIATVSCC